MLIKFHISYLGTFKTIHFAHKMQEQFLFQRCSICQQGSKPFNIFKKKSESWHLEPEGTWLSTQMKELHSQDYAFQTWFMITGGKSCTGFCSGVLVCFGRGRFCSKLTQKGGNGCGFLIIWPELCSQSVLIKEESLGSL